MDLGIGEGLNSIMLPRFTMQVVTSDQRGILVHTCMRFRASVSSRIINILSNHHGHGVPSMACPLLWGKHCGSVTCLELPLQIVVWRLGCHISGNQVLVCV